MKKFVKFIKMTLMLFVLSSMIIACGGADEEKDNDKIDIVCLGDSLTAGMSATTVYQDDKDKAYPAILESKLDAVVFNAGVSGDTTADALARLQNDVIDKDPAVVIICLGGNDFFEATKDELTGSGKITVNTIKDNLMSIVQQLDTKERLVVIAKFFNNESAQAMLTDSVRQGLLFDPLGLTDAEKTQIINDCATAYNELAGMTTTNVQLVVVDDIWTGIWGTANMSDDGIHPNAAGYAIMADNYYNALKTEFIELGFAK